jgi:D-lyxose ketol-isomerase
MVEKLWGSEEWLVNEPEYCMKILRLEPGFQSSLHYHRKKKETFILHAGACKLQLINREGDSKIEELKIGHPVTIKPGKAHRFWALLGGPCVVWEVSTHHDDTDVVRIEPSRPYYKGNR